MGQNKVKIASFGPLTNRRYSLPLAARLVATKYKFDVKSYYTGTTGTGYLGGAGDLMVIDPEEGGVYAYGQKDWRLNRMELKYAVYLDGKFVEVSRAEAFAMS